MKKFSFIGIYASLSGTMPAFLMYRPLSVRTRKEGNRSAKEYINEDAGQAIHKALAGGKIPLRLKITIEEIEINDLAGPLKFHTPAQRKHRLIALGHDIRCCCRPSRYTDKKVWAYRLYEGAQAELFNAQGGPAR